MKILHCLNHFLPLHTAGTEVYAWSLSKNLIASGFSVEVIIPNYSQHVNSYYEIDGIKVNQYAEPSTVDRKLKMGLRIPDGLPAFIKLVKEINPDIVHYHELAGSNGITIHHVEATFSLGFKNIMTFHLANYTCKAQTLMYKNSMLCDGVIDEYRCTDCMLSNASSLVSYPLSFFAKKAYKYRINLMRVESKLMTGLSYPFIINKLRKDLNKLVNSCHRLIVLTKWYEHILIENEVALDKIIYIPQGLINQNSGDKEWVRKGHKNKRFIFLGRISKYKGLHLLLDALQGMSNEPIKVDIYGSDPQDDYAIMCKNRIKQMSNVFWKGKLMPGEVVSTMRNYDALILPSTFSEMSPLVIQEAFAAKIPVIASNVYGNAEQIIDKKNGWLFKYNDSKELQELLYSLLKNPEWLRSAKNFIPDVQTFDRVTSQYVEVYTTILAA